MNIFEIVTWYLFVSIGGCVLAIVTMGGYCVLLFTSCFVFILLVCSLDPRCIHAWTFRIQMLWRTFWYLFIQYKEYYQCEAVDIRLFLAQRITSTPSVEEINLRPPPSPLRVVLLKQVQVLMLEWVRCGLICFLKHNAHEPLHSPILFDVLWIWCNNAAGLGFQENSSGDSCAGWRGLSGGDFWSTEASSHISESARRWNVTTALWLQRLVYKRCKHFPLFMSFSFSLWWHGVHLGHFVGFLTWAGTVKADHHMHRYVGSKFKPTWRKLYTFLSWINTQMIVTCIVITVDLRNTTGLRLLSSTVIGVFPLVNLILLFILLKLK
ncbi:LOW QUALITY PROTEIN: ghrelin O-acyltransferase [Odontesthes bonariensis]